MKSQFLSIFAGLTLTRFLEEIEINDFVWIVKRLSGNDTGLTGGHQSGLYMPCAYFNEAFPEIYTTSRYNPEFFIDKCFIPNADIELTGLRAVYYNSKFFPEKGLKKKYNECRITRWGGASNPLQDPENTGSIAIFAVSRKWDESTAVAWVAASLEEENIIEAWLGQEVEPGCFYMRECALAKTSFIPAIHLPVEWFDSFPTGREIFNYIQTLVPRNKNVSIDKLLLKRREIEFQVFEKIEQMQVLPNIKKGFSSVEEFIKYAHSVANRRKSRAGMSLELNLESIFIDEKIIFEMQVTTENRKKPDFLFPSGKAYHDRKFPSDKLHMLASKTCCKDRWRQILNEADRITPKHLFTLQQGVSAHQLQEMKDNHVELVVPSPFLRLFPKAWRSSILSLEGFVNYIHSQQVSAGISKWIS